MSKSASKPKFCPRNYLRPGLTQEEIVSIKEAIDILDSKKVGSIDPQKLKQIIANKGAQVQNKSIYQVICNLDREGSGNITFEQFVHLNTRRLVEKDSRENIATIFSLFDDQKSGFISVQSLRRKARELGLELEDKDFQDMIAVADQDRDGFISEEEFYQFVAFPTAH